MYQGCMGSLEWGVPPSQHGGGGQTSFPPTSKPKGDGKTFGVVDWQTAGKKQPRDHWTQMQCTKFEVLQACFFSMNLQTVVANGPEKTMVTLVLSLCNAFLKPWHPLRDSSVQIQRQPQSPQKEAGKQDVSFFSGLFFSHHTFFLWLCVVHCLSPGRKLCVLSPFWFTCFPLRSFFCSVFKFSNNPENVCLFLVC